MAKVTIDPELCTGCGLCSDTCPTVFELGEDDIAVVIDTECDDCDLKQVADDCPSEAIGVME